MKYRAKQRLEFKLNGDTREAVIVEPGDVLEGVPSTEMDQSDWRRMTKVLQKQRPGYRYGTFLLGGVVRAGIVGIDIERVHG